MYHQKKKKKERKNLMHKYHHRKTGLIGNAPDKQKCHNNKNIHFEKNGPKAKKT